MELGVGDTLRPPPGPAELGEDLVDVSLVLPCLNEELSLPHCLEQAAELEALLAAKRLTFEVVIADNGSTDRSLEIIEEYGARVVHCPVRGYGNALRWGIAGARGRHIVMADADGSYDFRESVPMIERLLEGYDVCMGSRFNGKIMPGAMPWKNRYIGNPALTGVLNVFFRSGLSDAHCGLRAFTKTAYSRINPNSPGMEFASEMVVKASLLELKCTEVPVTLHPDLRDRPPHLRPWQDGWRHLRFLFMLSPAWLYFIPAAILMALGFAILGILMATPPGEVARLGRFWIGEHWGSVATLMVVCGHQAAMLGLAATLVGVKEKYRKVSTALVWVFRALRFDRLFLAGVLIGLLGLATLAYVAWFWVQGNFGPLEMTHQMLLGSTLMIVSVQTILSAFLLSVVAGNDPDLDVVQRRHQLSKHWEGERASS